MEELQARTISFNEVRNVPETINAAVDFVRLHRKRLGKLILTRAFPFIIFAQALLTYNSFSGLLDPLLWSVSFAPIALVVAIVTYAVGYSLMIGVIFAYVRSAERHELEELDNRELWEDAKGSFWRIFGTNIGLVLVSVVGGILVLWIARMLMAAIPLAGVLFLFCLGFFLITVWSLYYPARFAEDYGFFEAFGRSMRLVKGRFWATLGFLLTWYLLLMAVIFFLYLPTVYYTMATVGYVGINEGTGLFTIVVTVSYFLFSCLAQLLGILPLIGLIMHYYSQIERNEYPLLEQELYTIGQKIEAEEERDASAV